MGKELEFQCETILTLSGFLRNPKFIEEPWTMQFFFIFFLEFRDEHEDLIALTGAFWSFGPLGQRGYLLK